MEKIFKGSKKGLLSFALIIFSFSTQAKNSDSINANELLYGTWRLISIYDSEDGSTTNPNDCEKQSRYTFYKNGNYSEKVVTEELFLDGVCWDDPSEFLRGSWKKVNSTRYVISTTYSLFEKEDTTTQEVKITFPDKNTMQYRIEEDGQYYLAKFKRVA